MWCGTSNSEKAKQCMDGCSLHSREEVKMDLCEWMQMQKPVFYQDKIFKLLPKWHKQINVPDNYAEKVIILLWNKCTALNDVMTNISFYDLGNHTSLLSFKVIFSANSHHTLLTAFLTEHFVAQAFFKCIIFYSPLCSYTLNFSE